MPPLSITAFTTVSALGRGPEATLEALRAGRGGLRLCDLAEVDRPCFIGRVDGVEEEVLPAALERFACRNNRLASLGLRSGGFAPAVAAARRRYGPERVAVVLGTSTSGIAASEEAFRNRPPAGGALPAGFDFEHTHDLFSLARFVRAALRLRGPASVVSTACSSSANTFADAALLLACGVCDAAVVGGADSLCAMTLHGFAALELLSPGPARPFAAARDGISIGEAAAFLLLERPDAGVPAAATLLGVGASNDAHHMSAPHPGGRGAVAAMRAALEVADLGPADIDYVNLHGTGTKANDAVEDAAVHEVFGRGPACSSTKGWTGHTLGTSGALEAVIGILCLRDRLIPGCLNVADLDPACRCDIATSSRDREVRHVLSNSFGFGGSNTSVILGPPP